VPCRPRIEAITALKAWSASTAAPENRHDRECLVTGYGHVPEAGGIRLKAGAHVAFDQVAFGCALDPRRNGKADLNRGIGAGIRPGREAVQEADGPDGRRANVAIIAVEQRRDQASTLESRRARERSDRGWSAPCHGLLARPGVSDGEVLATFPAATREDAAAILRRHPGAESVLVGALAATGLIGAFHR
jgi:hypothetical protein